MNTSSSILYTGSSTATGQPSIFIYTFNAATADLTMRGSFTGITNPSFLTTHPNGEWLYAVSETSRQEGEAAGTVWALHLTPEQWGIELINYQASGGDSPCHLAIDPTGGWLLVSNYGSGTVGVLPILKDGSLGPLADLIQHSGKGSDPEHQEGPHIHSATFSPDQRFVIVADLGIDALFLYTLDSRTGQLREHTRVHTRPGSGPRHAAFHPDGMHLSVANELDNTVAVYHYDAERGILQELQVITTLSHDEATNAVADIHISSSHNRLYVSNRGHDSIAVFSIEHDHHLIHSFTIDSNGRWPRSFSITPDDHFLLVANQVSDELVVLPAYQSPKQASMPITKVTVPGILCTHLR